MLASASPLVPTIVFSAVVLGFIGVLFGVAAMLAPWRIQVTVPTILACLIVVDLLYYVDHRCGHRIRLLWAASHSVHHSSSQFDQTTGLRISFIDGFVSPWFYLPAILIGFDPILVGASMGVMLAYQQWLHTETIGRLGWFDWIFNSPSNHRVHHGVQDKYIDKNYGAIFMLWDRMFGSYQREEEAPRYGLIKPIGSVNPIVVHFAEFAGLWRDLRGEASWARRRGARWRAGMNWILGSDRARAMRPLRAIWHR